MLGFLVGYLLSLYVVENDFKLVDYFFLDYVESAFQLICISGIPNFDSH